MSFRRSVPASTLTVHKMLESAGHHVQQDSSAQVLACPPSISARCSSWSEDDSQVTCYKVEQDVHVIRATDLVLTDMVC